MRLGLGTPPTYMHSSIQTPAHLLWQKVSALRHYYCHPLPPLSATHINLCKATRTHFQQSRPQMRRVSIIIHVSGVCAARPAAQAACDKF